MTARYHKNQNVIDRVETNGDCYLFDPVSARFRRLNPIGTQIWAALDEHCEVGPVADAVLKRCRGAVREKVYADVEAFLERLAAAQVVLKSDA
jgi:hypothetical protein